MYAKDEYGDTPLHDDVDNDTIDVVRLLINNGVEVNAKTTVVEHLFIQHMAT
ncbi:MULTISPECIES: hypothetical protein [unclassified Wolbachia]|uniref:hypothetical protein n=1 Tax=unclassified Wolbachia TaxID=2640676 RepID=UPI00350EC4AB